MVFSQTRNTVIAKHNHGFSFVTDTIAIKKIFAENVAETIMMSDSSKVLKPGFNFDKVSVERKIIPNNGEEYYYLLLKNTELHLKAACLLHEVKDDLVLFYHDKNIDHQDLLLNMTYIVCYGTDENCFPQINIAPSGRKYWTSTEKIVLYCDPNDPCKTSVSLILDLMKPAE